MEEANGSRGGGNEAGGSSGSGSVHGFSRLMLCDFMFQFVDNFFDILCNDQELQRKIKQRMTTDPWKEERYSMENSHYATSDVVPVLFQRRFLGSTANDYNMNRDEEVDKHHRHESVTMDGTGGYDATQCADTDALFPSRLGQFFSRIGASIRYCADNRILASFDNIFTKEGSFQKNKSGTRFIHCMLQGLKMGMIRNYERASKLRLSGDDSTPPELSIRVHWPFTDTTMVELGKSEGYPAAIAKLSAMYAQDSKFTNSMEIRILPRMVDGDARQDGWYWMAWTAEDAFLDPDEYILRDEDLEIDQPKKLDGADAAKINNQPREGHLSPDSPSATNTKKRDSPSATNTRKRRQQGSSSTNSPGADEIQQGHQHSPGGGSGDSGFLDFIHPWDRPPTPVEIASPKVLEGRMQVLQAHRKKWYVEYMDDWNRIVMKNKADMVSIKDGVVLFCLETAVGMRIKDDLSQILWKEFMRPCMDMIFQQDECTLRKVDGVRRDQAIREVDIFNQHPLLYTLFESFQGTATYADRVQHKFPVASDLNASFRFVMKKRPPFRRLQLKEAVVLELVELISHDVSRRGDMLVSCIQVEEDGDTFKHDMGMYGEKPIQVDVARKGAVASRNKVQRVKPHPSEEAQHPLEVDLLQRNKEYRDRAIPAFKRSIDESVEKARDAVARANLLAARAQGVRAEANEAAIRAEYVFGNIPGQLPPPQNDGRGFGDYLQRMNESLRLMEVQCKNAEAGAKDSEAALKDAMDQQAQVQPMQTMGATEAIIIRSAYINAKDECTKAEECVANVRRAMHQARMHAEVVKECAQAALQSLQDLGRQEHYQELEDAGSPGSQDYSFVDQNRDSQEEWSQVAGDNSPQDIKENDWGDFFRSDHEGWPPTAKDTGAMMHMECMRCKRIVVWP